MKVTLEEGLKRVALHYPVPVPVDCGRGSMVDGHVRLKAGPKPLALVVNFSGQQAEMRDLVSRSRRFSSKSPLPKVPSPSLVWRLQFPTPSTHSSIFTACERCRADDGIILIGRDSQRFPTPLSSHEANTVFSVSAR